MLCAFTKSLMYSCQMSFLTSKINDPNREESAFSIMCDCKVSSIKKPFMHSVIVVKVKPTRLWQPRGPFNHEKEEKESFFM